MSEPEVLEVDETPPPDVVAQPARSRGTYKLCMECGQNVLRPHFRVGSSVCKLCEAKTGRGTDPASDTNSHTISHTISGAAPDPLPDADSDADSDTDPDADPETDSVALEVPAAATVPGTVEARDWLASTCGLRTPDTLTLDLVAAKLGGVLEQQAQMIGRVTRHGNPAAAAGPEDIPLEVAAQALWLACDGTLQEALSAAQELLGLSLNQVILGNLAFSRAELLNQDQSLVPQASLAVQYGNLRSGQGRATLPGGRLLDASGQLVRDCLCCGREFHPPRDRPNPDFCDDFCGTFADQVRIWATNTVLDEMRYPGSTTPAPLPDARTFWPVERCQEPFLTAALAFREKRMTQQLEAARAQQQKMRGL